MKYKIPLFNLNFNEDEEKAVIETLRSKWISMGSQTIQFEKEFAQLMGSKYALATSNCTVALHLAMIICGVDKDTEVICPSLTFVATVNAINYVGAKPVFADIESCENLTISPNDIKSKINKKTKAIVVMHYAGYSCQMEEIKNIAYENNLLIIEDSCHAPLAEFNGQKLGSIGDFGCFSFFSNKNISTGEGGMIITDNKKYYERAKLLRSHGMTSLSYDRSRGHSFNYNVTEPGYNYRIDDIRSSIGLAQLKKIKVDINKRELIRNHYIKSLANINEIIIPFKNHTDKSSNYIFPIVLKNSNSKIRDQVRVYLANDGIETSIHYPPVHKFSFYNQGDNLPVTDYVADNLITLPMYGNLSIEDVTTVTKSLKNAIISCQNKY